MQTRARSVWAFEAIGTAWSVETDDPLSDGIRADVGAAIADFELTWSRFRDDSTVSALARTGGSVSAPADTAPMLDTYVELDAATSGAVSPLVGDALARLGYDARLTFAPLSPSGGDVDPVAAGNRVEIDTGAAPRWRELLAWDDRMLTLAAPATIDVGALGKGRLVDRVLDIVRASGNGAVVVDASGDLAVRGRAERVGLEHPYRPERAIGVWEVTDAALCASATNRRAWGDGLHHILDARTGAPVRAYAATWAVAGTALRADALATALFFDGGPELAAAWGAQWVRMRTDGAVEWSPGCSAELFR